MNNSIDKPDTRATEAALGAALELPCGAILKNRLVKAAMSDGLGDGEGNPTSAQTRLYERWDAGGTALSIIGEVQPSPHYPEKPGNLVLGPTSDRSRLTELASRATANGAHLWPQLGHAGALSHAPVSTPKGPSPIDVAGLNCDGLSAEEVEALPSLFATAASHAKEAGFTGVHLHAGHGFLLSQFLSPLFNKRKDRYGGSIEARSNIIVHILKEIRSTVGPTYPIGIKINSSDQLEGGLTEADALEFVKILNRTSVDLIDISGGTYFPGAKSSSDNAASSGPYFADFAKAAKAATEVPLMLTGGFRTRRQAVDVLADGSADVVGLARSMVLSPDLPNKWVSGTDNDPVFPRFDSPPAGSITAWFTMRIAAIGEDREHEFDLDAAAALRLYEERDALKNARWLEAFGKPG